MDIKKLNETVNPKTHKILWTVIGFLLLVVIFGSTAWYQTLQQVYCPVSSELTPCMDKSMAMPHQNSTSTWKTYTSTQYGFELKYPPSACEPKVPNDEFVSITCDVRQGFIGQDQLNAMGITYCEAYPNDAPRCVSKKIGNSYLSIDWGANGDNANASIPYSSNGSVNTTGVITFGLLKNTSESKAIFNQILATFKFTK